ncbi:hypothetical protein SRB5_08160 [Streptomyces sp. RB5]|uniref:Lipoprotein n=1 Tax=Streptomyces smaragdinus TaxID=2585196 RepID=A0A7K0CBE8_9ACTN|nr:hypothetical protein [Streptomyces smaragdinus]MQY10703.1 hypothetical protein [Streptomyces smaragdinus]
MGAGRRTARILAALVICTVTGAAGACADGGGGGGDGSFELQDKWDGMLTNAVRAKPAACTVGVGAGCEAHAAAIDAVAGKVLADVRARPDKDRYQAAIDAATTITGQYDDYFGRMCATVPEVTFTPEETQKFIDCTNLYTSIVTGVNDLRFGLRPSDESDA